MSKSKPVLASLCIVALGFSGYEGYRAHNVERQLSSARDESTQRGKRAVADEAQIRELQTQLAALQIQTEGVGKVDETLNPAAAAGNSDGAVNTTGAKPDDGTPVPASQIMADRRITPISADELAQRVQAALERTPETLTAVTLADEANMPNDFEWGSGADRRMWHMADSGTYDEVYPDGSYSVFTVLGHTTVNGVPGVIAAKDDGVLDAFVPDTGGRMVLQLRGTTPQAQWYDYRPMQNSQ
jgi:hypothetical protein